MPALGHGIHFVFSIPPLNETTDGLALNFQFQVSVPGRFRPLAQMISVSDLTIAGPHRTLAGGNFRPGPDTGHGYYLCFLELHLILLSKFL